MPRLPRGPNPRPPGGVLRSVSGRSEPAAAAALRERGAEIRSLLEAALTQVTGQR